MPGPIDDTLKHLTEVSPQDWVVRGGWPSAPAILIDADIATLTGATDKVIRVGGPPDWLLAIDFQAGHDTVAKLPDLLLYNSALIQTLLQGVVTMKESVTYQAIIEEGEAREARKILLLQGRSRFGEPSSEAVAALDGVTDVQKLEELSVRLLQATSWQELLGLD